MIGLNKGFLWWDVKKKCQTPGNKIPVPVLPVGRDEIKASIGRKNAGIQEIVVSRRKPPLVIY